METLINVVIPIFAILALGAATERFQWLGENSDKLLNLFVYYFALPVLLFGSMAMEPIHKILNIPFILAFSLGMLATFAITLVAYRIWKKEPYDILSLRSFSASFSNTAYMGIPFLIGLFGKDGLLPAAIATFLCYVLMMIAVMFIELSENQDCPKRETILNVSQSMIKNPLVIASLCGIAFSATGLTLPKPAVTFYHMFGAAAAPCALFAIGQVLMQQRISHFGELSVITALKLLLQPFITLGLVLLFGVDPLWAAMAFLLAALPTGTIGFILAQRYGCYQDRASAIILVSTLISLITLTIAVTIIPHIWPTVTIGHFGLMH